MQILGDTCNNSQKIFVQKQNKSFKRDLQQLRTGRLPMIDDAALELVALSEFSRSDHEEEEGEQGGVEEEGGMKEIFVFLGLTSGIGG